jgi:hypothetical protein
LSAVSVGTFVWLIDGATDDRITLLDRFNAITLGAFDGFRFWATCSGTAFRFVVNAFSIPAMILSLVANFNDTLFFAACATVIWASNGVYGATVDGSAHKDTASTFSTGANNLISTLST